MTIPNPDSFWYTNSGGSVLGWLVLGGFALIIISKIYTYLEKKNKK
ncbi:MAG: hypothetical protein KW804_00665 [Candidatus Doudnabacteria bacterium]|nr:hypothetical protein [Candidatus Doudnabacteria bacterium]